MAGVTLSNAVRDNLLSLQSTAKGMSDTQNKLATGLKVRSAVDNPTSFFTAQSLNARAGDLNTLLDNAGLAVQTLKEADEGLTSLTKLVEQAKSTATQALNTKLQATEAEGDVVSISGSVATAGQAIASAGVASTESITINHNGTETVLAISGGATFTDLETDINNITGLSASFADGVLTVEASDGRTVEISGSVGDALGLSGTYTNGVNRDSFVTDFNNLRSQIDQLASDASFNGVNLLAGDDLEVKFNEDGSSSLNIEGVTYNSEELLGDALTNADFEDDAGINAVLSNVDSAISTLRTQASTFGNNLAVVQTRQDFTTNTINVLESGAAGLTLADTNEEGANLLALQTRQQLGSIALSMANQADQAVLRLF
ncbi:flagellin [Tepidicaulis sp. LMO-SS28]|uniref:flagellin N-terminal helical domain-containing protein n=1 Tax=Tepidicaulis sp. LMO-SS28 TaxID=3447455 RepID=UPI003EE38014